MRNLWFVLMVVFLAISVVCVSGCDENGGKPLATKVEQDVAAVPQEAGSVLVKLATTLGDIVLELDRETAPITVANFLQYVNDGFFDGLIFHRVRPGFMIQGGGFDNNLKKKSTRAAIVNETGNQVRNLRGTIAMARLGAPNSATSQFFINHKNNPALDYDGLYGGYAVFGKVVEGMSVVDVIATVKRQPKTAKNGQDLPDCPAKNVIITSAKVISGK